VIKKIVSTFGLLDVREGYAELEAQLGFRGEKTPIPVTIEAEIEYAFGGFDGTSQEFTLRVTEVTIKEQPDAR
jgi:hypothetical protein